MHIFNTAPSIKTIEQTPDLFFQAFSGTATRGGMMFLFFYMIRSEGGCF